MAAEKPKKEIRVEGVKKGQPSKPSEQTVRIKVSKRARDLIQKKKWELSGKKNRNLPVHETVDILLGLEKS